MTLDTVTGPQDPDGTLGVRSGEAPLAYTIRAMGELFSGSSLAHEQLQDARHDQAGADRLALVAARAAGDAADARARVTAARHKVDPHAEIGRGMGTGMAITLAALDALPAYWTAEAFGFDQISTLILTVLLCAALGGAMWLLDLFAARQHRTSFRLLAGLLCGGFGAMFLLRMDYLEVTGGWGPLAAALQALALTAVSAALVAVGYVLLSNRVPKPVADAERQARATIRAGAAGVAAAASAKAAKSRAALQDTVVTWAVSHQPCGLEHDEFFAALSEAIDVLLRR